MDPVIAQLSNRQKDCLRLVRDLDNSKEIARKLGLSRHTVDSYIREATKALGATSRYQAARILAARESEPPPQSSIPDSSRVEAASLFNSFVSATSDEGNQTNQDELYEGQALHLIAVEPRKRTFTLPFPTAGRETNDLSTMARIGWVVAVAALAILAFSGVIGSLEGLGILTENVNH